MTNFLFYCDESYDSQHEPAKAFVVGGFFAGERIWEKVQRRWSAANSWAGVSRFHASHLNARDHEFETWSKARSLRYSKRLLRILNDQGHHLHAVSCGLLGEDYEQIIPQDSRAKLGNPYIACFKTCIVMIAKEMKPFPAADRFSVILDRSDWSAEAVAIFNEMKNGTTWEYGHRLGACTSAGAGTVALEAADLAVYETFRYLYAMNFRVADVRAVMRKVFDSNGFTGFYYDAELFESLRRVLEKAHVAPNGIIPIVPTPSDDDCDSRVADGVSKWNRGGL
jgi:hypothetical protein